MQWLSRLSHCCVNNATPSARCPHQTSPLAMAVLNLAVATINTGLLSSSLNKVSIVLLTSYMYNTYPFTVHLTIQHPYSIYQQPPRFAASHIQFPLHILAHWLHSIFIRRSVPP